MTDKTKADLVDSPADDADVGALAKGGVVQVLGNGAGRALGFVFAGVAVRVLSTSDYGVFREVVQVLSLCGILASGGFNLAVVRYLSAARAAKDAATARATLRYALVGSLVVAGVLSLSLYLAADAFASFVLSGHEEADKLAALLRLGTAYIPLFTVMQVLRFSTHTYRTMVPSVLVGNVILSAGRSLLALGGVLAGFGLSGAVSGWVAAAAVAALTAFWFHRRLLPPEERTAPRRRIPGLIGPMGRFAFIQSGNNLLNAHRLGLPVFILGFTQDLRAVGLYSLAHSLLALSAFFLASIFNISNAVVSDLHSKGALQRLQSIFQATTRWSATFSFPFLVALVLEGRLFLSILGGDAATAATGALAILAVGNAFYTGTGPSGPTIAMTGHPGAVLIDSFLGVLLYGGLGLWAATEFGLNGMAAAAAFSSVFLGVVQIVQVSALIGIRPFGRSYIKPVIATAVMAVLLALWKALLPDGSLWSAAGIVISGAAYVATLLAMGLDDEDRMVLDRLWSRARRGLRRRGSSASK